MKDIFSINFASNRLCREMKAFSNTVQYFHLKLKKTCQNGLFIEYCYYIEYSYLKFSICGQNGPNHVLEWVRANRAFLPEYLTVWSKCTYICISCVRVLEN